MKPNLICGILFSMLIAVGSLCAQPISNPLTVSSKGLDVYGDNLIFADSSLFCTGVFRYNHHLDYLRGSYILKLSPQGVVQDSLMFDFLPSGPVVISKGFYHNDSLTLFGTYPDTVDPVVHSFIIRLSTSFSGYRHRQVFSHPSTIALMMQVGVDTNRQVYYSYIDRLSRFNPNSNYYFEFDIGSLNTLKEDTLVIHNPPGFQGLADFKYFFGSYYGMYRNKIIKYSQSCDSVQAYQLDPVNHQGVYGIFVPNDMIERNAKLYMFGQWSTYFPVSLIHTAMASFDRNGVITYKVYPRPQNTGYEDQYIDYDGIFYHRDKFLLLATLNFGKAIGTGNPLGVHTDIMIKLVDTASLALKHEYIISDTCLKFVVSATTTPDGFVVLYHSNCENRPDYKRNVKLAFFNDQAQMLSNVTIGQVPSISSKYLTIFPNPVQEDLSLELSEAFVNSAWTVKLYDLKGDVVKEVEGYGREAKISLSSFPPGSYFLVMEGQNGIRTSRKFVKIGG